MSRWHFDQLQAIAVSDPGGDPLPWRPMQLAFALKADPSRVVIPLHYSDADGAPEMVVGEAHGAYEIEQEIAEGLWSRLDAMDVPAGHRVVAIGDGRYEAVDRDLLIRRRNHEMARRLQLALDLARASRSADEVDEAFEAAGDVDPRSLVANVLRCGWYCRAGMGIDAARAVEDLLAVEPDPSRLGRVRSQWIWESLDGKALRDELLRRARTAAEEHLEPGFHLDVPVPESVQLKATVLAALRRKWGFQQPADLPHDDLALALRGAPEALERVDVLLSVSCEWRLWTELIDRSPARAISEMQITFGRGELAFGRARCEDLVRLAQTWYTLESNADEPGDRLAAWRGGLSRIGDWQPRGSVPWRNGERLAEVVRERCGLNGHVIDSVRTWLQAELGVRVDGARLRAGDTHAVGALPQRAPPCIFIDGSADHDVLSARFGAAHELGHLLLGGRRNHSGSSWYCAAGPDHPVSDDAERLANAFAVYFIAPRTEVQKLIHRPPPVESGEFVERALEVRDRFGLPVVAAGEHLLNCTRRPEALPKLPPEIRDRLRLAARSRPTGFDRADEAPRLHGDTSRSEAFSDMLSRCVANGSVDPEQADAVLH